MRRKLQDLFRAEAWRRQLADRFGEPLHLTALSLLIGAVGDFRAKVAFDLVRRRPFAFSILRAADYAAELGVRKISVLEFGVAPGTGLINMCRIAATVSRLTGVEIEVIGFDTGTGLPAPRDYRDHPERYGEGDFPMDREALESVLPENGRIIYGDIAETAPRFIDQAGSTIGFVSIDVDYYWSTVEALKIFTRPPERYLPMTVLYFDDIRHDINNPWCGELLAIREFNKVHDLRKIAPFNFLRNERIKKRAAWLDQIYVLNVLDHPARAPAGRGVRPVKTLPNPYLTSRRR